MFRKIIIGIKICACIVIEKWQEIFESYGFYESKVKEWFYTLEFITGNLKTEDIIVTSMHIPARPFCYAVHGDGARRYDVMQQRINILHLKRIKCQIHTI